MTQAILAGALIGIGNIALMMVEDRAIGAVLFSLALLSIIKLSIPLYTGRIGFILHTKDPLRCAGFLAANAAGSYFMVFMWGISKPDGIEAICRTAESKFSQGYIHLLVSGIFCGILIHIAVVVKSDIVTVLCIACFILSGFRHCIADAAYIRNPDNLIKWLMVVIGNSLGAIGAEMLIKKGR